MILQMPDLIEYCRKRASLAYAAGNFTEQTEWNENAAELMAAQFRMEVIERHILKDSATGRMLEAIKEKPASSWGKTCGAHSASFVTGTDKNL